MKWNEIINKLNKNDLAPIYVLNGSEKYLINDFIHRAIAKYIPEGMEDLNLNKLDTKNFKKLRNECLTPPFMAEKRIIIIEDASYFNCSKDKYESSAFLDMIELIENIISNTTNDVLVIFAINDKLTPSNPIVKRLKKNDCIVSYNKITNNERAKIAVKLAQKENKRLSLSDATFLVEYVGSEMFKIKNEVEKLCAYSNDIITRNSIKELASPSTDYNVFQMIKAITNKNSNGAFSIFRDMLKNGEYVGVILSLIARQYRVYAYIDDIDKEFKGRVIDYKLLEKRLGSKDFVIKTMYNMGKRKSQDERIKVINDIVDADYLVKIGQIDAITAVENLIIKLVG